VSRLLKHSILAALAFVAACGATVRAPAPTSAMGADVSFLTSPALAGREAATPGADSAAEFLVRRYQLIGLHAAFHSRCASTPACADSYFQYFQIESGVAHNVGAVVDGSDPLLRTQFVVLGAHYDHLGRSPTFSLDRERGFVIRPGADDNASGTAGLLELARRFHDRPARRSLLIVNFDAEELGLIGSRVFLDNAPVPLGSMTFMLNLDMIGRLRESQLFIEGTGQHATRALIDSAVAAAGIRADFVADAGRSDHSSFLASSIDAVMLSTGMHRDYHKASDIAARVDLAGMERVVDVAELIARRMADR
jgi:acetylornithine deacetylase/succinyl-diaminopimelate desuccinylase-like protein